MLETMPYADLLTIYNAIADKPVTRFDTRANGVRRTEALLGARGLMLPEAARMADVVLADANSVQEEARSKATTPNQTEEDAGHENDLGGDRPGVTIQVEAAISLL
jgi:hypothetical protein